MSIRHGRLPARTLTLAPGWTCLPRLAVTTLSARCHISDVRCQRADAKGDRCPMTGTAPPSVIYHLSSDRHSDASTRLPKHARRPPGPDGGPGPIRTADL